MTGGLAFLLAVFAATLAIDVPIAFGLGIAATAYILLYDVAPVLVVAQRTIAGIDSFPLLAIPLFLLAGELMGTSGMTRQIVDLCAAIVGRTRGGLALVAVLAMALFSALSGSAVADVLAIGSVMLPAMRKRGYDRGFSCALLGCAGTLGPVIPPSITMIVYGTQTNTSIGQLFVAGVVPGLVLTAALLAVVAFIARGKDWRGEHPFSWGRLWAALRGAVLALLAPVVIIGGIRFGYATATEAAGVAVAYALLVGFLVQRTLNLRDVWRALLTTAETTGAILLLIGTANLFGWILAAERLPQAMTAALTAWTDERWVILLFLNVLLLLLGTFMETLATIIILAPVLMPILQAYGIDPVHFGIVLIVNLSIGGATPPLGVSLAAACRLEGIPESESYRYLLPLLGALLVALALITYLPGLSLWLPRALG